MSDSTEITIAVWLYMLGEGGHLTVGEVAKAINRSRDSVAIALSQMEVRGYVLKWPNAYRRNGVAFSVTPSCKVPQWVVLKDVLQAVERTNREVESA